MGQCQCAGYYSGLFNAIHREPCDGVITAEDLLCDNCRDGVAQNACIGVEEVADERVGQAPAQEQTDVRPLLV